MYHFMQYKQWCKSIDEGCIPEEAIKILNEKKMEDETALALEQTTLRDT